jgi:hypothetical protein
MRRAIIAGALLIPTAAFAFGFNAGGGAGATKAYVDTQVSSMQAAVMAAMPQPANMAPPTDSTAAAIGSTTSRYMLQDSVRPARYRSATGTTSGGSGVATITWSTPFASTPNPLGDPSVVNANASTSMIQCNWTSISTTGATVTCRQPLVNLTISLGALTLLPAAPNGLVVSATAVQPL